MSRIDTTLAGLKQQGRKALIPYLMAGFPEPNQTLSLMQALVDGGFQPLGVRKPADRQRR